MAKNQTTSSQKTRLKKSHASATAASNNNNNANNNNKSPITRVAIHQLHRMAMSALAPKIAKLFRNDSGTLTGHLYHKMANDASGSGACWVVRILNWEAISEEFRRLVGKFVSRESSGEHGGKTGNTTTTTTQQQQDTESHLYIPLEFALFLSERNCIRILKPRGDQNQDATSSASKVEDSKVWTHQQQGSSSKSSDTSSASPPESNSSSLHHNNQSFFNMHQLQFHLILHCNFNIDLYTIYSHLLRAGYYVKQRTWNSPERRKQFEKRYQEEPYSFIIYDAWYYHLDHTTSAPQLSVLMTRYTSKFPSMKLILELCEHEKHPIYFCMMEAGIVNFMRLSMQLPTVSNQVMPLDEVLREIEQAAKT